MLYFLLLLSRNRQILVVLHIINSKFPVENFLTGNRFMILSYIYSFALALQPRCSLMFRISGLSVPYNFCCEVYISSYIRLSVYLIQLLYVHSDSRLSFVCLLSRLLSLVQDQKKRFFTSSDTNDFAAGKSE